MADDPKPNLALLGEIKSVDDVAAFYKKVTGRDMTDDERAYAAQKLGLEASPKPEG